MAPRRTGRGLARLVETPVRCAIYTRKSTDEGLDSDFSTLDNQRERAEAYAASQGWAVLDTRYDDGGFSGSNIDRPAFQRLLKDLRPAGLTQSCAIGSTALAGPSSTSSTCTACLKSPG